MATLAERKALYARKRLEYQFEVATKGVLRPRADEVAPRNKYGLFARIPFPERMTRPSPNGETVWLFTSREQSVRFAKDYGGIVVIE